ncbi:MAG: TRAP transporter small permease [Deltaproteobacteria bacterium]|nr:TRAP transporter small permease [Deltaproteobacteria bacterium]
MNPKSMAMTAEKLINKASHMFCWVSVIVLIFMTLFITVDIIGRYVFSRPITGSIDFVVLMMVIIVFPCLAHVTTLNRHVRTDIIFNDLSKRGKGAIDIINSGCSVFIIGIITWQLGARVVYIIQNPPGVTTEYFQIPHYPFIAIAAVGCGLMTLELIIWFIRSIRQTLNG